MHPHFTGEIARLRIQDMEREAAARHPHMQSRHAATPSGFLLTRAPAWFAAARSAGAGVRHAIGVAMIRAGMRIADPSRQLGSITPR